MSAIFDKGITITNNEDTTAERITVQSSDGTMGYQNSIFFDKISTGLISGGHITINTDNTKYDISSLVGLIANFDNASSPVLKEVIASPIGGITPAYLNTSIITYVAIDEYGLVVEQATPFTTSQERDLISLGAVIHSNKLNINVVNNIGLPSFGATNQLHDFMDAIGALNLTGNKFSANGANLKLNKSAGVLFKLGSNAQIDWRNPHQISQEATSALTFRYRTQIGDEGVDITDLDSTKYDNAGTLTNVPSNKYTIQTVTLFQAGAVRIQYGQDVYNSLDEAEKAISTRSFVTESNIASNGVPRAYIILKNGTSSLQNANYSKIIEITKFGGVSSGGLALTFANITAALGFTPENAANKNTANGYAGLGFDGKLLSTQLPSITVTDTFVVANQAAMLAIIGETGDVAVRTDLNKSFILKGTNPSVLGDWQELLTPTDAVQSFNGRTGTIVPTLNDYTTDQVQETATRVFQTPAQRTNNDATSSIQTQLNSKALDSSVVHLSGTETISGNKVFTGSLNRFDNQLLVNQLLLKKLGLTEYNQIGAYNGRMEFLQNSGTQFSFNMATDYFDFGLINKVAKFSNALLTANRTYSLPNADGTLALTSDLPTSANYIQNGTTQQTANLNISGSGVFGSSVTATRFSLPDSSDLFFSNSFNNWSIKTSSTENKLRIIDNQFGAERLFFDANTATFSSNVTASSFIASNGTVRLKSYTVATLPAGVQGDTAYVTDALGFTYNSILTGGGSGVTIAFFDGTNWRAH